MKKYVKVTQPGISLFSRFSWKGEVVGGKVKLKPGFNMFHFCDMEPVESYQPSPKGTRAGVRNIIEISEAEFNLID